jgi:hypothetical protein
MHRVRIRTIGILLAGAIVCGAWSFGFAADQKTADSAGRRKDTTSAVRTASDTSAALKDSLKTPAIVTHKVIAYYFHGNVRCASCRKIEAYTKEVVDSSFADDLKANRLEWRVINTDSSVNEHYLEDYQLFTKSVVVSDVHNGTQARWKNLDKIWELLGEKEDFQKYVRAEIAAFVDSTK